jgi:hypothetical protein
MERSIVWLTATMVPYLLVAADIPRRLVVFPDMFATSVSTEPARWLDVLEIAEVQIANSLQGVSSGAALQTVR